MLPFVLMGALIAASEPLWEVASLVGRIAWNIVCKMAFCTAVSLVVWAVARVLWPGLSVWPFVLSVVFTVPALLVFDGWLRARDDRRLEEIEERAIATTRRDLGLEMADEGASGRPAPVDEACHQDPGDDRRHGYRRHGRRGIRLDARSRPGDPAGR